MLLCYGNNTVDKDWLVKTNGATGFYRIYYVEKGMATYISESEKLTLEKDHIYIFPNTISYDIYGAEVGMTHIYLHITTTHLISSKVINLEDNKVKDAKYIFKTFKELMKSDKLKDSVDIQNSLSDSLLQVLNSYNLFEQIDEKISESIRFILNNLEKNVSIEELASLCGYHPKYYISIFSKTMGMTPHQFIIQSKMKTAFSLLMNENSISKVANLMGYSETKNFTRAFKEKYGIVPSKISKYTEMF